MKRSGPRECIPPHTFPGFLKVCAEPIHILQMSAMILHVAGLERIEMPEFWLVAAGMFNFIKTAQHPCPILFPLPRVTHKNA